MSENNIPMIYKQISEAMASIDAVSKNRKNDQQGYKFRGIEDMYNAVHPAMIKAGIFSVPRCLNREEFPYNTKSGTAMLRVVLKTEYDFTTHDGSKVTVGPIFSEGNDSADKATNKALSAAHKYALIQLFCIPTEDIEDADRTTPELGQQAPKNSPPLKNFAPRERESNSGFISKIDPGEFKISFGLHSGKMIKEIPIEGLKSYYKNIVDWADIPSNRLSPTQKEFLIYAEEWIKKTGEAK